jgi:hypothetical protein
MLYKQSVYTNISPGNDLSSLSLAIGTWLGRRTFVTWLFDIGSNCSSDSPSDLPSDLPSDYNLTEQITCRATRPAVILSTRPDLCHWRLAIGSSSSSDLPSASLTEQLDQQILSQSCGTEQFDIGNNSSSDYLQSDSLTPQIPCRATLAAVVLPATRSELSHWLARHKEQLFKRLLAHQVTYLPSISPIVSPRALSLA